MSLLRIYASLREPPKHCRWALVSEGREPVTGEGPPAQLPQRAERVQLVLPAADVLVTRVRLPQSARRRTGAVLTFAVEEAIVGDPDANQVTWLGSVGEDDVLAVLDQDGLKQWHDALEGAGIRSYEIHCEALLLPWAANEWTLAWNGSEAYVRSGQFEGAATDCGDRQTPPLALRLALDEAKARVDAPTAIAVYSLAPDSGGPDLDAWQRSLGIALRPAGSWDWRTAPADAGVSLAEQRARWRLPRGTGKQLRPAAWIVAAVVAVHTLALVVDWTRLASEQRSLRTQMEQRFRAAFPDAVAVADPPLQMRRKLAEARHAAGQTDSSDFLPMIEKIATAMKEAPPGTLRVASYDSGRMTLELSALQEPALRRIVARLRDAGLQAEPAATRGGNANVTLTVRAS